MRDQTLLTTLEKYSLNRKSLTRNLLLTIFCLFHPPKPKGYRWTICFESNFKIEYRALKNGIIMLLLFFLSPGQLIFPYSNPHPQINLLRFI